MIQANELRLGNNVYRGEYNNTLDSMQQIKALFLGGTHVYLDLDGKGVPLEDLYGIPLTPELLEKCGFEHPYSWRKGIWIKDRLQMAIDAGAMAYLLNEDTPEAYYIPGPCDYLHQLQNLFFALTGTELTVNL